MFEIIKTELKLSNQSEKTIEAYIFHNKKFIEYIKKKPQQVTTDDVKKYISYLMDKGNSTRTIRLAIAALKCYYQNIMKRNIIKNIHRPKLEKTIPAVLENNEIMKMIEVTKNPKHKLLITLLYSSGVRISEALKLKKENLNLEKKYLFVKSGKGKKDRFTKLSDKFIEQYLSYEKEISNYLFESSFNKNKPITIRTAEMIIENSARLAGIQKPVYPHMIRRTFATHLIDNGTQIHLVSSMLGHSHIETTKNSYIKFRTSHLDNIKSPMDAV